jgi:hypothetical protein
MLKKRPFFPLVYLLLILFLIFQSACMQITVESSSPNMTPRSPVSGATYTPYLTATLVATYTPYVTDTPSATYTPYVTASPSVATADTKKDVCTHPVTRAVGEDGRITYQGISFLLPPELGGQVEAWACPFIYIDPNNFMASHPPFVAFRFPTDRERIYYQPELYVYRVEGDMNQYWHPLNALGELLSVLDQKTEPAESWFQAPLKLRGSYVPFAAGKGVRGVVQYAHDYFFFTNNDLLYDFHGLTDDGRYYVHMQYPLAVPFLMDIERGDPSTNVNPQAIPIPAWTNDLAGNTKIITDYNHEALHRFEQMGDEEFAPNLSLMDRLITSLTVK